MGLIRTVIVFVILVILFHVGMEYMSVNRDTNGLTEAFYSLGLLLEAPAAAVVNALPLSQEQQQSYSTNGFYFTALSAAGIYFLIYLLLGVGRRG